MGRRSSVKYFKCYSECTLNNLSFPDPIIPEKAESKPFCSTIKMPTLYYLSCEACLHGIASIALMAEYRLRRNSKYNK